MRHSLRFTDIDPPSGGALCSRSVGVTTVMDWHLSGRLPPSGCLFALYGCFEHHGKYVRSDAGDSRKGAPPNMCVTQHRDRRNMRFFAIHTSLRFRGASRNVPSR